MPQKLIVLELNEVPLRLLSYYAEQKPSSSISQLLHNSLVLKTLATDVEIDDLYPSQTWASFNTGVAYKDHQIYWYNDPKSTEYPTYWKIIADSQRSVGLVNTLHSSPADQFIGKGNYKFLIPDCFAANNFTFPAYYQSFQSLNLKATNSNSRVTTMEIPVSEVVKSIPSIHKFGITSRTIIDGCGLLFNIFTKKVPKERLRSLQFPLLADIFFYQLQKNLPDVSVLFTNHVAANMHRYWYALFPEDYSRKIYDLSWVEKYKNEIILSLDLADIVIEKLIDFCQINDYTLVVVSSMGQHANQKLNNQSTDLASVGSRLIDINKFVNKLTTEKFNFEIRTAMQPQCSIEFATPLEATNFVHQVEQIIPTFENISLVSLDLNVSTLTFTVSLDNTQELYGINGIKFSAKELGFVKFEIDDHHSGCHYPDGTLIIFNSKTAKSELSTINYLEYAPAVLAHFNITKPDYMLQPTFQF